MSDAAVKRPPILTGACLYLGLLAAVISTRAVTVVSSWNAENRAADVSGALRVLRDAGMGADAAESAYKVLVTVIAVLAAAGAVFAVFTARGDRASRVGMTVTVGIAGFATFVGALGATFFLAMLGALAVVFTIRLWTGEIRTYFRTLAGHPPPPPKVEVATPVDVATPVPAAAPERLPAEQPWPPQQAWPVQQQWPPHDPSRREPLPKPVAIAVWTALGGSALAIGASALWLLVVSLGFDYDAVMEQGGPGTGMIGSEEEFDVAMRFVTVLAGIAVVIGIGGLLAAIRVLVTRRSGSVPLFVMTVSALIVTVVGFPIGLPWTAATIVVLVQLRTRAARAWFVKT
ncbi:hypothetical protein [Aeromicrobium fastidiosum]|uniref:Uncharacterized protein n=1 Tax=Aeromicrobium fastidiosum TaxID=52699 RepID=A0A641AQ28_9ACTN|nr:hypothetical protein [Aeromicrobium fastidiosum]KAA1380045.1 hypothetical protein ESP62_002240 [Aeromicrobium fastidiosum]MBP2389571.1 hypothetical protein [Aeromicrobium fastidiosum]